MMKTKTQNFIEKSQKIHGRLYDYTKVVYENAKSKVLIGCKKHGYYYITPNKHLNGAGCQSCSKENRVKLKTKSKKDFVNNANIKHEQKYDYSLVSENIKRSDRVEIICAKHGIFEQTAQNHLQGQGCPQCGLKTRISKRTLSSEEFINRASSLHDNFYDYSKTIYTGMYNEIEVICPNHGNYHILPVKHLHRKQGCPECSKVMTKSKAVIEICKFFDSNGIRYIEEYKINECRNIHPLPFDFYLIDYDILIEYDGIQHFKPIEYFGGQQGLDEQQYNDNIKNEYCKSTDKILLRIRYDENYLEKIKEFLDSWDKQQKV
ncbi:DUF723 domain-containing protein [Salmonella enterica subsp. enterica serovar Infantis]|nr:DUF723 domain-containing protein [Salmonella enterica subsp. enterica serovar Infantis]